MDKPALIPEALLLNLEKQWPNRCPDVNDSDREIWISVGVQQVLASLRARYNSQNKKD